MADNLESLRTELGYAIASEAYSSLEQDRKPYETRGVNCAKVTIPSLFADETADGQTIFDPPRQTIGARGVNNLASKLMFSLFPPERWLRLNVPQFEADKVITTSEQIVEIDEALNNVEEVIMNYFETNLYRVPLFEGIKLLLVSGNFLLYMPQPETGKETPIKLYKLYNYVVQRDSLGEVTQIVIKEDKYVSSLPEDLRALYNSNEGGDPDPQATVAIYTHVFYNPDDDTMNWYEQMDGIDTPIEGTDGSSPRASCPYVPVRMIRQTNEHYGRSYTEEYLGGFTMLENLSKSITDCAAMASQVFYMVNPASMTMSAIRALNKAKNGEFIAGKAEDIQTLQVNKQADLSVTKSVIDDLKMELTQAFLLQVSRNAERVTAEEVRQVSKELEAVLGGVYSVLTKELQLPMVKIALRQLQAVDKLPNIPEGFVDPVITTGIDAMGRGQDAERLQAFIGLAGQALNLGQSGEVNISVLLQNLATSLGVRTAGLLPSAEDKAQQQQEQAAQQGMGQAVNAAGAAAGQVAGQAAGAAMAQQGGM